MNSLRLRVAVPILVVWVTAMSLAFHWGHPPIFDSDDMGQYLSHARALREGRPYTDIGFLFTPYNRLIGPTAEPPTLPVLSLLLLTDDGGFSTRGAFLLAALFLVGAAVAQFVIVRRTEGAQLAVLAAGWSSAALLANHAADTWLADLPFIFAIWLTLAAADSDEQLTSPRLVLMAVGGALAFSLRMAALPLIPATVAWAWWRGPRDRRWLVLVLATWVVSAWLVMRVIPSAGAMVDAIAMSDWLTRLRLNAEEIRYGVFAAWLHPFDSRVANQVWSLGSGALAAAGLLSFGKRAFASLTLWFFAAYTSMLLLLPTGSGRYAWPMYGLLTWLAVRGIRSVFTRWPLPRFRTISCVAIAAVVGIASKGGPPEQGFLEHPMIATAIRHLRATNGETVRAVYRYPRLLTWHARIEAAGYFTATPDETVRELNRLRITHIVMSEMGSFHPDIPSMRAAIAAKPAHFSLLRDENSVQTYRFLP